MIYLSGFVFDMNRLLYWTS